MTSTRWVVVGLILSLVVNALLAGWLVALNDEVRRTATAVGDLQQQVEQAQSDADEAMAAANTAQTQVENTGTLTRFAVTAVTEQLSQLVTQTLTLTVPIQQDIPIATSVTLDENFEVPIQTTVPINAVVKVPVNVGIFGTVDIDVPLNLEVPISLTVNVPFRKEIPIETTVPLDMEIPVSISLKDTPLAAQIAQWRETLAQLGATP